MAINTRRATERFPRRGYAELKAQIVSAAESVVINIIEGCGASSQRDFARFLDISIKSAMELEGEFELAYGYGILPERDWLSRQREIIETRKMLHTLREKVLCDALSESSGSPDGPRPAAPGPTAPERLLPESDD